MNGPTAWRRLHTSGKALRMLILAATWFRRRFSGPGLPATGQPITNQALVTFQRDLQLSTAADDQARAYFWIGKTQQILGDAASAQSAWQQAASLDPTDYYSLRSQDMLLKRPGLRSATRDQF